MIKTGVTAILFNKHKKYKKGLWAEKIKVNMLFNKGSVQKFVNIQSQDFYSYGSMKLPECWKSKGLLRKTVVCKFHYTQKFSW